MTATLSRPDTRCQLETYRQKSLAKIIEPLPTEAQRVIQENIQSPLSVEDFQALAAIADTFKLNQQLERARLIKSKVAEAEQAVEFALQGNQPNTAPAGFLQKAWNIFGNPQNKQPIIQPQKLWAVFDIDDTIWDTGAVETAKVFEKPLAQAGFGLANPVEPWRMALEFPVIRQVRNLIQSLARQGVNIFLVSGRWDTPESRATTIQHLNAIGLRESKAYKDLHLREAKTERNCKPDAYRKIEKQMGRAAVFVMGDQDSDFEGLGPETKRIWIKNPYP